MMNKLDIGKSVEDESNMRQHMYIQAYVLGEVAYPNKCSNA